MLSAMRQRLGSAQCFPEWARATPGFCRDLPATALLRRSESWFSRFHRPLFTVLFLAALVSLLSCGGHRRGSADTSGVLPDFNSYTSVAAADLNGDGLLDIAVSYSRMAGAPPHPGWVAIYLQDAGNPGSFLSPAAYSVGNDPVALAVGDLNSDGKPDIVTANTIMNWKGTGSSNVSVLLQDSAHPGHFFPAVNYATGFSPVDVAMGDLNGDGLPDLAVADTTGISILFENPAAPGQFLSLKTIAVGSGGTSGVAINDLNGDGLADLAATAGAGVNVYLQNPAQPGTFLAPNTYLADAQPYALLAQDLNADGRPDIAVANLGSPDGRTPASLSVLLQNPTRPGTFLSATSYPTGIGSWSIAAADLDGNGNVDLAVGNMGSFNGGSISILLQDPVASGSYKTAVNYADKGVISWVAIGDVNGDGKPDLVIAGLNLELWLQDPAHPGAFLAPAILASF